MYLKIHETRGGRIVAVCDEDLIGKVFQHKDTVLDLDKYRDFYVGTNADKKEIENALKSFSSANIIGKNSVAIANELKLVSKDDIVYINKVPHVQIYKL